MSLIRFSVLCTSILCVTCVGVAYGIHVYVLTLWRWVVPLIVSCVAVNELLLSWVDSVIYKACVLLSSV
jgi:hypothetical protein